MSKEIPNLGKAARQEKLDKLRDMTPAPPCSLPSRSELSIRISDALDILDDLERAQVIYGGFAKEQLRRLRNAIKTIIREPPGQRHVVSADPDCS